MSQLTNYAENKLADFVRGQGLTLPGNWYIALGTAASDSAFTEMTGTAYARISYARSLANWAGTQGAGTTVASSGTSHATTNNNIVNFGTAGSAWGTATQVGIFDASTAGNCWMYLTLDAPLAIGNGDGVSFSPTVFGFTLGLSGGMSDYLANKMIDLLFRAQAFTWPATAYLGLFTAAPTNAGGGTEVTGGAYARATIASTTAAWSATDTPGSTSVSSGTTGRISNNATLTFPAPTANWGTVTHGALLDAATTGNMLFWGALATPKSILSGASAPTYSADKLAVTFA